MAYLLVRDTEQLAVCCLYLLLRRAVVDFPGTTRSSPSLWVVVSTATGKLPRDGDAKFFPCRVPWYVWQGVVIPVLTVSNPWEVPLVIGSAAIPNTLTGQCLDLGVEIQTTLRKSLRIEGNVAQIGIGEYDNLIAAISQELGLLMVEQGLLPAGRIPRG